MSTAPTADQTAVPGTETADEAPLSPKELLALDLLALQAKLKAGKTLLRHERQTLERVVAGGSESQGVPAFADSQSDLAGILSSALGMPVSRQLVSYHAKKLEAPCAAADGRHDVNAWLAFMRQHSDLAGESVPELARLKAENILLQNKKLTTQIAILNRQFISARDAEKVGARLGAAIRKVVTSLHLIAPSVVGLTVPEAENLLKEKEDEIIEQLHVMSSGLSDLKHADTDEALADDDSADGNEEDPTAGR